LKTKRKAAAKTGTATPRQAPGATPAGAGNQAAQSKMPLYMPGMCPDNPVLSAVTDEMRLNSLAQVLGELAGRQAALTAKADELKRWLAANKPSRATLRAMRENSKYKLMLLDLKIQQKTLKVRGLDKELAQLKLRDASLAASIEKYTMEVWTYSDEIHKINDQLEIVLANEQTRKEQEEHRKLEALATRLGERLGLLVALKITAGRLRASLWKAMSKGPPASPKGTPNWARPAPKVPSRKGASTLMTVE